MDILNFVETNRLIFQFLLSIGILYVWTIRPKQETLILSLIIITGLSFQIRFGQFHIHINPYADPNEGTLIHVPDTMVYQMGSKYFEETKYKNFYTALTQALKELGAEKGITYPPVIIRNLNSKSSPLLSPEDKSIIDSKKEFNDEKWIEYKKDILNWEIQYTPYWSAILQDYGYNASPFTSLLGKWVNQVINPEKARFYYLVDLCFILATIGALYWGFGLKPTLYTLAIFLIFPSGFFTISDWVGSFLRFSWVFWMALGISFLNKRYFLMAGASLALCNLERIFPTVLLLSCGLFILLDSKYPINHRFKSLIKYSAGALISTSLVIALTIFVYGTSCWFDFTEFILGHSNLFAWNHFGWTKAISLHEGLINMNFGSPVSQTFELWGKYLSERNDWVLYKVMKGYLLLICLLWAVTKAKNLFGASLLSSILFFVFSTPAHYYSIFFIPLFVTGAFYYSNTNTKISSSPFTYMLGVVPLAILSNSFGQIASWSIFSVIIAIFAIVAITTSLLSLTNTQSLLVTLGCLFAFFIYPSIYTSSKNSNSIISGSTTKNLLSESGITSKYPFEQILDQCYKGFEIREKFRMKVNIESDSWGKFAILKENGEIIYVHEVPEAPNIITSTQLEIIPGSYKLGWFSDIGKPIFVHAEKLDQ